MCISKDILKRSPRSPYRRHLTELGKPRLSRSVIKGARVNLNHYWAKFEELSTLKIPIVEFQPNSTVTCQFAFDNDINENLSNEFKELGK